MVLERSNAVGGIARTENYKGYFFDGGGHRFFTKNNDIKGLWQEVMGDRLLTVSRLSRIHYKGRFFNYPLSFSNALSNLGLSESLLILLSQFFIGYRVSFLGSIVGFAYGWALGTLSGTLISWIYNKIVWYRN